MAEKRMRSLGEGALYGVFAGAIFAFMEVIASALMGNAALEPFRMFASVVLGRAALDAGIGGVFWAGLVVHLALSSAFGLVYAALLGGASETARSSYGRQTVIGLAYGFVLWLVNFQVIARIAYTWFLDAPQLLQALMHMLFFGLPLGLMYAAGRRRITGRVEVARPAQ